MLLPIRPTVELAEIAADLLTDGHIAVRRCYNSNKYAYVGFFSDDYPELERFNLRIKKLFGKEGSIKEWGYRTNGRSRGCIVIDARLARLLECCGIPAGDKITKGYTVPQWIFEGNRPVKGAFLRRSFTCEGSIDMEKNGRWEIRYSMHKQKELLANARDYLETLRELLREFGIESHNITMNKRYKREKDGKTVVGLMIRIRDKQSLINYATLIGFDSEKKKQRLTKMLNQVRAGIND